MTEPMLFKLLEAQKQNDHHTLKEIGHSLKGGARSACLNILGDLAAELQDKAELGEDTALLTPKIIDCFAKAKTEINSLA